MDSSNWRVKRDPSELLASTPNRSFQQRRTNGLNNAQDSARRNESFNHRSSPVTRSPLQSVSSARKPLDEASAEKAIDEGRRLYVGNLLYDITVKDIELLFKDFPIEAINMSVDPFTGRNPSYCFVDVKTKELADRMMKEFNGRDFRERPLKVKPGVRSGTGTGRFHLRQERQSSGDDYAFDRWRRLEQPEDIEAAVKQRRRLYIEGLPRFKDQPTVNSEIRELLKDYTVEIVGKLISAREAKKDLPGHHDYCFVDLATAEEASRAVQALNETQVPNWDSKLKVRIANGSSHMLHERRRLFVGGLPEFPDKETTDYLMKELFTGYTVTSVSKLFLPKLESIKSKEGNHCYCFVELSSDEDADNAIAKLDWKESWGGNIRVKPALSGARSETPPVKGRGSWDSR